jgi:2,4-dienoyl-CoA reductase-like NADH-dependent reductase (Old Yellow Enzyme family)
MSQLFREFTINNLTIKNRFIMSAAADNLDNNIQAKINRFTNLAQGQIGLIISGGTRIDKIEALSDIVSAVHENGGKFAVQFVAESGPGFFGKTQDHSKDSIAVSELSENHIYFKSLAPYISYGKHHAAREAELIEIMSRYVKAAVLTKKIGADAFQVHAAHQSFLSQMLSPITNTRNDKWGGSIENRTRLHKEICRAIRAEIGNDYPILIKFGVQDAIQGGLKFEEGREAAKLMANYGYDAIEISQGLQNYSDWNGTPMHSRIFAPKDEAYFKNWCSEIKQIISIPTILTGGIRSIEIAEQLVQDKITDCIGICRPFIREPDLIKLWQNGAHEKAKCISCNKCITELLLQGKPLECYLDKVKAR